MANLYELMSDYDALQQAFEDDEITMEDLEGLLNAMDESKDDLRVKVDNICRLLRNADGEIDKFRAEEKRLAARRKATENKKERVRDWLKSTMDILSVDEIKTNVFVVQLVEQGHRVIVVNEDAVPEEYMRVKRSPDLTKIQKAYTQDGEVVAGCDVVMQKAMRIR